MPAFLPPSIERTWNGKQNGFCNTARHGAIRSRRWGSEIASGVNDSRAKFLSLLKDTSNTLIVVEHRERLTRFGFHSLETLLETQGRTIEVVNMAENDTEDLIADLVAIVYYFTARQNAATAGQTQNRTHDTGIGGRGCNSLSSM